MQCAYLPDELQDGHLEDITPHRNTVQLAQQVRNGPVLRMLTKHEEGIPLGGKVLLCKQHLHAYTLLMTAILSTTTNVHV